MAAASSQNHLIGPTLAIANFLFRCRKLVVAREEIAALRAVADSVGDLPEVLGQQEKRRSCSSYLFDTGYLDYKQHE